jgi:hypothetical protein
MMLKHYREVPDRPLAGAPPAAAEALCSETARTDSGDDGRCGEGGKSRTMQHELLPRSNAARCVGAARSASCS